MGKDEQYNVMDLLHVWLCEVASILLWLYYEVFSSIIEGAIQIEREYTSDRIYSSLDLSLGLWLVKFQQALRAKLFSMLMRGKNSR